MSQIAQILEELRSDGVEDSQGFFTIDFEKAREKLQKFQLVDPHLYVTHAVAAAVAGGASQVEAYVDADDCILTFDGEGFPGQQLDELFSYLLVSRSGPEVMRLKELAIALNAALALKPQSLQLTAKNGVMLELQGARLGTSEAPRQSHNRLHIRQRLSFQVVGRFLGKHVGRTPEQVLLQKHCLYAPVVLNGKSLQLPLSHPKALALCRTDGCPLPHEEIHPVLSGGSHDFHAALYLLPDVKATHLELHVCQHRVLVTTVKDEAPYSVYGVIDHPGLAKNVSQSDLVRDEAFKSLLTWVRARARDMLAAVAQEPPQGAFAFLRHACARELKARDYSRRWGHFKAALADARVWRDQHGAPIDLRQALERGSPVIVAVRQWDADLTPPHPLLQPEEVGLLERIFEQVRHDDESYRLAVARRNRALAWARAEPRPSLVDAVVVSARHRFERGEMGLIAPTVPARVQFFKQGKPLVMQQVKVPLPRGVVAAIGDDALEPNADWDGVLNPENAYAELQRQLPALYETLEARFSVAAPHFLNLLIYCSERQLDPPQVALEYPLFLTLDGRSVSLAELRKGGKEVGYLELASPHPAAPKSLHDAVLLDTERFTVLDTLLPGQTLVDRGAEYVSFLRGCRFIEQPERAPRLGPHKRCLARRTFKEGEVGLLSLTGNALSQFEVLYRKRFLCRITVPLPHLGPIDGVVDATDIITPNPTLDGIEKGLDKLEKLLTEQAEAVTLELVKSAPTLEIRSYVLRQLAGRLKGSPTDTVRALLDVPLFQRVDGTPVRLREILDEPVEYCPDAKGDPKALVMPKWAAEELRAVIGKERVREWSAPGPPPVAPAPTLPLPVREYFEVLDLDPPFRGKLGLTLRLSETLIVLHGFASQRAQINPRTRVPFHASVETSGISWTPQGKPRQNSAMKALREQLEERALALYHKQIERYELQPDPRRRAWLQRLCLKLRLHEVPAEGEFERRLAGLPLLRDHNLRPAAFRDTEGRTLAYLPESAPLTSEPLELPLTEPLVLRMSADERELWPDLADYSSRWAGYRHDQAARELTLEAQFPGVEWWLRLEVTGAIQGQLGITLQTLQDPGIWVRLDEGGWARLHLPRQRRCCGVLASRTRIQPELLQDDLKRLEAQLARRLEQLTPEEVPAVQQLLRDWRDWSTLPLEPNPGVLATAARPFLGLAGEARRDAVETQVETTRAREEEPPMPEPQPLTAQQRLAEALRSEMRRVAGEQQNLLQTILFGSTPKGTFCQCSPDGKVTLNPKHPLIDHLMNAPTPNPEYLYFALSALYSVINRARQDIHDQDEREFHRRLVNTLLET